MKTFSKSILFAFLLGMAAAVQGQVFETRSLKAFDKVVVSPLIDLDLIEGDEEEIELSAPFISSGDIVTKNDGKTLRIYLKGAKITYRSKYKNGMAYGRYHGTKVKAVLTYKTLRKLQIRGEQQVELLSPIAQETFKIKSYGENEVYVSGLDVDKLKLVAYGENKVFIDKSTVGLQLITLYGESKVDAVRSRSQVSRVRTYGESELYVFADDRLKVHAMGESKVSLEGKAAIQKRLVLGEVDIDRGPTYSKRMYRNSSDRVKE